MKSYLHKKSLFLMGGGGVLLTLALLLVFTTCDIGLGQIVNTEKPVIKSAGDDNLPGSFLQGNSNKIELDVKNSLGFDISVVYIEVEYVDLLTQELAKKQVAAYQDEETGNWLVDLGVTEMEDGQIRAWVTAVDASGNSTTSTEITYFVKNKLPQIKLTIPSVSDDDFDNKQYLDDLVRTDLIYQGLDIMGLATDNFQIMEGWPKIMFWPSNLPGENLGADYIPTKQTDPKYGQWRTVELPLNYKPGSTVAKFSWPLAVLIQDTTKPVDDPARWRLPERNANGKYGADYVPLPTNEKYRFRIWVRDGFGNDNFYPNRIDNKRGSDNTPLDPSTSPNKYIEITHQAIGEQAICSVPDMKDFYNRTDDFTVYINVVSAGMDVGNARAVEAFITEEYDSSTGGKWGPYYAEFEEIIRGGTYSYKLVIPAADANLWGDREGVYYLTLQAEDSKGDLGPLNRGNPFVMDLTPPTVQFDQPGILDNVYKTGNITGGKYTILYPPNNSRPKWVTATVTTGGKSVDPSPSSGGRNSNVAKVYYHIGKHNDDKMTNPELTAFYNDDNAIGLDGSPFWKDTMLGTAAPAPNWSGSVWAWTYTERYPIGYKGANPDLVQELSELGFIPADDTYYATAGVERFYLPMYVKVVDEAGNRQIVHYKLSIDPLMDEPQVTFIYPTSGATVGGTVRMSGSAEDNIWMNTVLMRIHKAGEPANTFYIPTGTDPFFGTAPSYSQNTNFPAPVIGGSPDKNGWFKVSLYGEGPMVTWTANVNADGGLNPAGDEPIDVQIEVVAYDSASANAAYPNLVGPVEKQTVRFSAKVPRIEDVKIAKGANIREYNEGITTSGEFVISMKISAIDGIKSVSAKVNSDLPVTVMLNDQPQTNNAVWNITNPVKIGDRYESTLTITVNSTVNGIVKGLGYGKTGVMNLEISVVDRTQTEFSTTNSFRIGIDNFYPSAEIETSTMAYDDITAKKYFMVQGTAKDWGDGSGTLQGLERVLVYFEKAKITYTSGSPTWAGRKVEGNQQMLKPNGTAASSSTDFEAYPVIDTAKSGWSNTVAAPNETNFAMPKLVYDGTRWTSPAAMVIDFAENDPEQDYDGDGTYGEKWIGLTDKTWEARMLITNRTNSAVQQFPDGPYMVHYIIMDQAGNATHYQKDIYVENNKPRITKINIGTDINFNDSLTADEYRDQDYNVDNTSESTGRIVTDDSVFRIRNNRFGVKLTLEKGNGNRTATVTNVVRGGATSVENMERGRVYQIAATAASTDFTRYGAPNNYTNTVFVAAGKGAGTGTVYPLNQVVGTTPPSFPQGSGAATTYNTFANFTGIDDRTDGLFLVKVYDTTVSTSSNEGAVNPEFDQLAQTVLLTVSINNTDSIAPKIDVANFGRRHVTSVTGNLQDYDANSLSELNAAVYSDYVDTSSTGTKNGYVQYQEHSTPNSTANISGKVIFNGKVTDNHRINRITVTIPGYNSGAEFNIATRNISTGLLQATNNVTGEREFRFVYSESQVPQFSLAFGQTLVWQFMWDSSKISTVAQNGVNITFRVYDQEGNSNPVTKTVNIVPYILEVETSLSGVYKSAPSAFDRSARGWYPVRESEPITIRGFNLGTAVGNAAISGISFSGGSNNGTTITSTVPVTAVSGPLVVTVNGIASFNNSSNKSVDYNKEPNNVNNNILDNSRNVYVWTTGSLFTGSLSSPFMRMDSKGTRYLSYGQYTLTQTGRLIVRKNNDDYIIGAARTNRMINTTVAVGNGYNASGDLISNSSFYAMGSDLSSNTNQGFQFAMSTANGRNYDKGTGNLYERTRWNAIKLVDMATATDQDRFKIARVAVQPTNGATDRTDDNADRILISYYDGDKKEVRIIYGNVGALTGETYTSNASVGNIAGTTNDNADGSTSVPTASSVLVTSDAYARKGSMFTAAGFLNGGVPVVAWYDGSDLVISWVFPGTSNTGVTNGRITTNPTQWQANINPIDTGKGTHVDMAVDGANNIHLAYYSSDGGLYYAYVPTSGGEPDLANKKVVGVDTFLSAGTKIMINVRKELHSGTTRYVPYITYAHASFPGTKSTIRVAWRTDFTSATYEGTNEKDLFTGKWEVMTVPVSSGVIPNVNEFVCNGVPVDKTGWLAPPSGLTYSDIDKSILVGYMTDQWYEGAILKRNLW
jgi:hypothetical protein